MANDEKPKPVLRIPSVKRTESAEGGRVPVRPLRSAEQLAPLLAQIASNAELMSEYHSAVGSKDHTRVTALIDKIETFARTLDPTVTRVDAVSMAASLAALVNPEERR